MSRFSFSIGETHLSPWEAGRLGPGDVVVTGRDAGCPGTVLVDNLPVGAADAVVLGHPGTFGCRLVDSDFRARFEVDPGRLETLGEQVPATVELGSFEGRIDQVWGLPAGSILHFGTPLGDEAPVQLRWGGALLARGQAVLVGEKMAFRVVARSIPTFDAPVHRLSGNLLDPAAGLRVKEYDFTRPDRFSVDQLRRLEALHRLAWRHLTLGHPELALGDPTQAIYLDQCTLGEARQLLAGWGLGSYRTFDHDRRRRAPTVRTPQLFEAANCPHPLDPDWRREFFRPRPEGNPPLGREVFVHGAARWVGADAEVAHALEQGWRQAVDFPLAPSEAAEDPRPLDQNEMVIVVVYRAGSSPQPSLGVVYPFLTLEPYLGLLGQ